jgi:hypothetical protein
VQSAASISNTGAALVTHAVVRTAPKLKKFDMKQQNYFGPITV